MFVDIVLVEPAIMRGIIYPYLVFMVSKLFQIRNILLRIIMTLKLHFRFVWGGR